MPFFFGGGGVEIPRPKPQESEADLAAEREAAARNRRRGFRSTIATSARGVLEPGNLGRPSLRPTLGGSR